MSFTKDVILTYITQISQVTFRMLGGVISARVLGPSLMGIFTLIQMIAGIASNLGNLGVGNSTIYFLGKNQEKTRQLASNALLIGIAQGTTLIILIALFLPLLQSHLEGLEKVTWPLWAIALAAIPFQLLIVNFNSIIRGQNRIVLFNRNNFVIAFSHFILIFLFLIPLNMGLPGRLIAFATGSMLGTIVTFAGIKKLYNKGLNPDFPLAKNMLKFGSLIHATTVIQFLNYRLDIFMLGYFCPSSIVGYYFVAVTLGEMLWYLPNSIGMVLFPVLSRNQGNNSQLTLLSARNNLFIILVFALLMFAGAEFIIRTIFSDAYVPAVHPLQALLPGIVGFSLAKILSPDLVSRGKPKVVAIISMISLAINVILNLILVPRYQATGAAMASTFSYLAGIIMLIAIYCKLTGHRLNEILFINKQDLRGYRDFIKIMIKSFCSTMQKYNKQIKRCIDIILSLFFLIIISPLMLLIVLTIIIESGRPALFIQERAGLNGRPFYIYKFRTMLKESTKKEVDRITRVGRILRATSLDELPQLINVFKGDMSLVGPRPTLMYQVEKYDDRQKKRLDVLPGITGWAQVNGGEQLPWKERIDKDIWYIENQSIKLDLKILWMTLKIILKGREAWVEQSQDWIARQPLNENNKTGGGIPVKDLVIIGAGGFGREVLQLALDQNNLQPQWNILGFIDDNPELKGTTLNDYPVLGNIDWLAENAEKKYAVIALGEPEHKKQVESRLKNTGIQYATLIHPSSIIGEHVEIGEGNIITAGVVMTVNIKTGKHVIFNLNSCVGHDCIINNYVTIAPNVNIMGSTTIGDGCYIATGVTIRDKITIGSNSIIGLGAVVIGDLPGEIVALGCPAKKVRDNTNRKVFSN